MGQLYAAVMARAKPTNHLWAQTDERCTCLRFRGPRKGKRRPRDGHRAPHEHHHYRARKRGQARLECAKTNRSFYGSGGTLLRSTAPPHGSTAGQGSISCGSDLTVGLRSWVDGRCTPLMTGRYHTAEAGCSKAGSYVQAERLGCLRSVQPVPWLGGMATEGCRGRGRGMVQCGASRW
eukprot:3072561-Prymnesium_polylepis.1